MALSVADAMVVVLVLVLTAVIAGLAARGEADTLIAAGWACVAVGGLCVAAGGLCAAAKRRAALPLVLGGKAGGPPAPGPPLTPYQGENLTADEIAAAKSVFRRQPMARLPTAVDDLPATLPYRPGVYPRSRTTLHVGQRKLLLSEVDFLADHARDGDTVVYAGAAPGIHIPYLASLFRSKDLRFRLYDPRKFALPKGRTGASARITAVRGMFTDETAASYAGRDDVLFISDIRTGTDEVDVPDPSTVAADMALQEGWVLAMQPRAAMLKFRLPYGDGDAFEYLAGTARLQAWAPASSAETRLIAVRGPGGYARQTYSPADYDRQLFYLNSVVREWGSFDHGVSLGLVPGLDHCFGCALEAHIWGKYLGPLATPAGIAALFNDTTRAISRGLAQGRHGVSPSAEMPERRALALGRKLIDTHPKHL